MALFGSIHQVDFPGSALVTPADDEFHGGAKFAQVNVEAGENADNLVLRQLHQAEEDMARINVAMIKPSGLNVGQSQSSPCVFRELF